MQLDRAAVMSGKSEVTLRRLIKSGKVPFEKRKTLTGFIYMVDPELVKKYYATRNGGVYKEDGTPQEEEDFGSSNNIASTRKDKVRVAVVGESGDESEYWRKKAESYEEKYYNELTSNAKMHEELGVWRGRAEHAQAMLIKLLPSPREVDVVDEVVKTTNVAKKDQSNEGLLWTIVILISVVGVATITGLLLYYFFRN